MSTIVVQPLRPGLRFWLWWMLATVIGVAAGMFLSFPFQFVLEAALGTEVATPWTTTTQTLIVVFKGAEGVVMGMGMGLGQWWVIRKYLKPMGGWVFATGLAFFLQGAFRWSLPFDILPQQVGATITLSFGIFLGFCQWFVLRRNVRRAEWWIAINIAGWMPAFALMFAPEFGQILGMVLFAITMLVPFAVAGVGMIWLLRQTTLIQKPEGS